MMLKSKRLRLLGGILLKLICKERPWITVCSNCQKWRPKESSDESDWMYPYKDYPPHTPRVSHGLCTECHGKLYPTLKKRVNGSS